MSVATREQSDRAKHGGWLVIVQGVPYAWADRAVLSATIPVVSRGTGTGFAPYDDMAIWGATGTVEGNAIPIDACLAETPELSEQSIDYRAGTGDTSGRANYRMGTLRVRSLFATAHRSLFAFKAQPIGQVVGETLDLSEWTADLAIWGDVTAQVTEGRYLYIGRETFRCQGDAAYDAGEGWTTVTAYRSQCGSGRWAIRNGAFVYTTPPAWKGRRIKLLRVFEGETDTETWWTGQLDAWAPYQGNTAWELMAIDLGYGVLATGRLPVAAFRPDSEVTLKQTYPTPWYLTPPDIAIQPGSVSFGLTGEFDDAYNAQVWDGSAPPADVSYFQIGDEAVRASNVRLNPDRSTSTAAAQPDIVLEVNKRNRGLWGTEETKDDASNIKVCQLFVLEGHPIEVAARLLQGGIAADSGITPVLPTYGGASLGAGLTDADVDTAAFAAAIDELFDAPDIQLRLGWGGASIDFVATARRLIANCGCALLPDAKGRLGPRFVARTLNPIAEPTATITDNDLVREENGEPCWPTVTYAHDQQVSEVHVYRGEGFKKNYATDRQNMYIVRNENAADTLGSVPLYFDAAMLFGANERGGFTEPVDRFLGWRLVELLDQYASPPMRCRFVTSLRQWRLGLGDVARLSLSRTIYFDPESGEIGTSADNWRVAIDKREVSLTRGTITFEGYLSRDDGVVIAPSALVTGYNAGTGVVTCAANQYVIAGSNNPGGATDAAHFVVGTVVRFWRGGSTPPRWLGSGTIGYGTVTAFTATTVTITADAALAADPPANNDIMGCAPWPISRNLEPQKYYLSWASDGATVDVPQGDERLPVSYGPTVLGDNPFRLR